MEQLTHKLAQFKCNHHHGHLADDEDVIEFPIAKKTKGAV